MGTVRSYSPHVRWTKGEEEISQIAVRFPEHLQEKVRWEWLVGQAAKHGFSTFFNKGLHEKGGRDSEVSRSNCVQAVVEWAKTGAVAGSCRS